MQNLKRFTWLVCLLVLPFLSWASLGGDESSIQSDHEKMKGVVKGQMSTSNYTVHEFQLESGTTVKEFINNAGQVFAIRWNGPSIPNLQQLYGNYHKELNKGNKSANRGHHSHQAVNASDVVIQTSGHMRAFYGVAYLPTQLPAGVSIDELQ